METLLTGHEVDLILRYPAGRTERLARAGKIPCIHLPDGEVRFPENQIIDLVSRQPPASSKPTSNAEHIANGFGGKSVPLQDVSITVIESFLADAEKAFGPKSSVAKAYRREIRRCNEAEVFRRLNRADIATTPPAEAK